MDSILPNLIEHLLNFLITFAIINILFYKPVANFVAKRAERVKAEQEEARLACEEAEKLRAQYSQIIDSSKHEAAKIIAQAEIDAKIEKDKLIAEAKARAEQLLQSARDQIENERVTAVEQMRDDFASLAVQIASKVLEREVSAKDNEMVIDDFFEKVS